jgi:hypothetical protein
MTATLSAGSNDTHRASLLVSWLRVCRAEQREPRHRRTLRLQISTEQTEHFNVVHFRIFQDHTAYGRRNLRAVDQPKCRRRK